MANRSAQTKNERLGSIGRRLLAVVFLAVLATILPTLRGVATTSPAAAAAATAAKAPGSSQHKLSSAALAPHSYAPSVNYVPANYVLGTYGNVGQGAVGDCSEATAATYEQLAEHSSHPLASAGYLAEYDKLVAAEDETPGPAGTMPQALFADWETTGVAGTTIAGVTPVALTQSALEHALESGPLFVAVVLPAASSQTLPWVLNSEGIITTPWTSASVTPPYTGGATEHAALAVGFDSSYIYVATWGVVLPVSWSMFESMVNAVWSIQA